jgi:plasmanylethanolamine desaturase
MNHPQDADTLPVHDSLSWLTRVIELASIVAAVTLATWQCVRLVSMGVYWHWWSPALFIAGILSADFVSGIVHWTADTWGSEAMPILGRRFIRPFRVHHVNPDDFLRRNFVDTNGDVAMIVSVILAAIFFIPLDQTWGQASALFLVAFAIGGLPTNQVHQWAHMPVPPRAVQWLQRRGFILSRSAHCKHHAWPYVANYCIATGWCNRVLAAVQFFPRMEKAIARVTGCEPRSDDQAFSEVVLSGNSSRSCPTAPPPNARLARSNHD